MHILTLTGLLALCLQLTQDAAWAQSDLEDFWQRGHVRELFIGGLPADDAGLQMWADNGVNCVTGVKPELAHKHGLKTRTWFTMNSMSPRWLSEDKIKAMAAINEDGSYRRPYDALFPSVAKNWTACVNNPLWIEHSRAQFRSKANAGYDGCHIDYASHYEPCHCEHCQKKWDAWAPKHGLEGVNLKAASHAEDLRTRMLLREFRIQCVMEFLGDLRKTAQAIRPGFATDGTWHRDSGSTYQWAYGDHFDLMCIEGTTYGPFPPASQQIIWLKLAHALSRRPDNPVGQGGPDTPAGPRRPAPIAMSVTYHLLTDEERGRHHGRMAPDRLRVALAEIVSQGAVSWLGLGGPGTGNLLREHQDIVKAYFSLARDIEPLLVDAQDVAEIGIVFSPKSYLLSGGLRAQLYAIGQALMRAHVPFKILSDVGLDARQLEELSGVVLLSARALSDATCKALELYVRNGGKALVIGSDAATLTEDWRERAPRPRFAVPPEGEGEIIEKPLGKGRCYYWVEDAFAGKALGAAQNIVLNQEKPIKLAIEGWSKAEDVSGGADSNYSLYVDLMHQDGNPMWGQTAQFATGTHDWQFSRTIIESEKPFRSANIHMLFRYHRGTVWFKDVKFGVWDEEKQQIVKNLLGDTYKPSDGKVYSAAPGEDAQKGAWGPYRDGFEVENMLDMGLWVKMSCTKGLGVGAMNKPDKASVNTILEALAPLRPAQPMLTIEGKGADLVFANLTRAGNRIAIQLINYNAELHPELPELEQQKADRSIPATDLVVSLKLPVTSVVSESLNTHFPETSPKVACETDGNGVVLRIDKLDQYGVIAFEMK